MGFLNFGKKKQVPDELPDLISDEIEQESAKEVNSFLEEEEKKEEGKSSDSNTLQNSPDGASNNLREKTQVDVRTEKNVLNRLVKNIEETPERRLPPENARPRKSFFSELKGDLSKEIVDTDSFESWFNDKFVSRDVLSDMRDYWENQKTIDILDTMTEGFQEKITKKIEDLQKIEAIWQSTYFELVEREEEIKDREQELKDLLKEFTEICKHRKNKIEAQKNPKPMENNKNNKGPNNNNGGKNKKTKNGSQKKRK